MSYFNQLNQTTEACLGDTLTFECSTVGGSGSTVFQGDLLDCNGIVLLHSRFGNMSAATCNNGTVRGYSLPTNDSEPCYTSQLHVTVSPDMIGKSIICVDDNGTTANQIGNFSIEQCHATIVTKTALSTGKLIIHAWILQNWLIFSNNFRTCMDRNHCLRKLHKIQYIQQYNHRHAQQRYIYTSYNITLALSSHEHILFVI